MSKAGRKANRAKTAGVPRPVDWRHAAAGGVPVREALTPRPPLTPAEVMHLQLLVPDAAARLVAAGWRQSVPGMDGLGRWDRWSRARSGSDLTMIHSIAVEDDGRMWGHVSVSHPGSRRLPSWEVVRDTFRLVYPDRPGVIVVPVADEHYTDPLVEVHHVWVCLSERLLPDFRRHGKV